MRTREFAPSMLLAITIALSTTSCRHKGLEDFEPAAYDISVVFDWQKSPDANPASMAMYLFDASDGNSIRYIFDNRDGGPIRAPFGTYSALAMNSDNTDWVALRNTSDVDLFEARTLDLAMLSGQRLSTYSIPRARGTENERLAATPQMLWGCRQDEIKLADDATSHKVITLYPDEVVCHYTVIVEDIKNLGDAAGAQIDATLSGMSEGYCFGAGTSTDNHVTMGFTLAVNDSTDGLEGSFLTFGECPHNTASHTLTLYFVLSDGTHISYNYDVTAQVTQARDPRHVIIVVKGPELPAPVPSTGGTGGFIPKVDEWQSVDIDLDMNV